MALLQKKKIMLFSQMMAILRMKIRELDCGDKNKTSRLSFKLI